MDGLLIGRFQPFHLGHLHAVGYALLRCDRLWIGIGSSNRPVERSNPFSPGERREMILSSLDAGTLRRTRVFEIPDLDDHARWAESVKSIAPGFGVVFTNDELTSHIYSRQGIEVSPIPLEDRGSLSGTGIRERIAAGGGWQGCVPDGTRDVLIRVGAHRRLRGL